MNEESAQVPTRSQPATEKAEERPRLESFADLSVRFTSDFQIELSWAGHKEVATYDDLGLADRRGKGQTPNTAWRSNRQRSGVPQTVQPAVIHPEMRYIRGERGRGG